MFSSEISKNGMRAGEQVGHDHYPLYILKVFKFVTGNNVMENTGSKNECA